MNTTSGENNDNTNHHPAAEPARDTVELAPRRKGLRYWWFVPLLAGALMGVIMRLVFSGRPGGAYTAMADAFVYLVPLAVGAVTVYVAETKQRRSWGYYIWASVVANLLFVLATMIILIEGMICAIIIAPLFALLGALGGLMMGAVCRATEWPKHTAYSLVLLPLLFGAFPVNELESAHVETIERSISVHASPETIWNQIHAARNIKPIEVENGWIYRIGVPLPIAGITRQTPDGLVRKITMGKSVHFDQVVADWQVNRYVRFTYRFDKDSFPPGALDDHVRIGGHYFDLIDTSYELTPISPESTNLKIKMTYRVSTQFNWYANTVATLLIGNFEEVILNFYRQRSINGTMG